MATPSASARPHAINEPDVSVQFAPESCQRVCRGRHGGAGIGKQSEGLFTRCRRASSRPRSGSFREAVASTRASGTPVEEKVHFFCAAGMFLVLAYFSFFLFTKSGDAKRLAYLVDFIEV